MMSSAVGDLKTWCARRQAHVVAVLVKSRKHANEQMLAPCTVPAVTPDLQAAYVTVLCSTWICFDKHQLVWSY